MDFKTPDAKSLRSLPYSELKKLAKRKGIKSNMKAEKLIAALTAVDSDDSECFSTPAAKELNSCKKNKEAKFNEDKATPLATPRRGTYSLETPASVKVEDIPDISEDIPDIPLQEKTSALDESNITIERGSERKLRSRKVSFLSPVLTPQTPKNSSLRLRPKTPVASATSLCEQVSPSPVASARKNQDKNGSVCMEATPKQKLFPSEDIVSGEPTSSTKNSSLKRKSTTLNDGASLSGTKNIPLKRKSSTLNDMEREAESPLKKRKSLEFGGSSTKAVPLPPQQSLKKENAITPRSTKSVGFVEDPVAKKKLLATPNVESSGTDNASKKKMSTPGFKKSFGTIVDSSLKKVHSYTPRPTRSSVSLGDSASKKKALATPNFKKIHEKAFAKMESIDEYQKRKAESAKKIKKLVTKVPKATSKITTFGGISFVPSARPSSLKQKLNVSKDKTNGAATRSFLSQADSSARKKSLSTPIKNKSKAESENSIKKKKFDLKASLSRKLGYKPYTGPLKPLAESNKLDMSISCLHKPKETENTIVKEKRLQNRTALKGVRTNKRFELQMKNRQLV